ncbi:type I restriction/modification system, specificity subunit [Campylobacter upsaliensis RM3940]|nr:restriction endonuclease subunit S [Campylobacter upsaliensis]QKF87891.1 type I restriction/modification system, specificity subunit [Campylobacter upsaliensis RM3940]
MAAVRKKDIIYKYCDFMAYDYADFKDFMSGLPLSENLKNNEIFKEYLSDFSTTKPKKFKKQKLKDFEKKALFDTYLKQKQEAIKDTKAYNKAYRDFKESKDYKELEKALHYEKFLENVRAFECEKMHSFILIENEKILILKAPDNKTTDNKSNKANIIKFLGYDWSKRKGDEGIKYQTTIQDIENTELKESEDDSDEDKKQKEALRNINSVKFINTPLYNPQNPSDPTKLCYAIKSFIESSAKIDSIINALQSDDKDFYKLFISDMKAMLDFNKVDFNKAISLNPINSQGEGKTQNPFENCKFELVRISELMQDSEIALDIQSAKRPKGGVGNYTEGALSLGGEHIDNKSGYVKMQTPKYVPMEFYEDFKKADKGIVRKNDILLCKDGALTGKVALVRDEFENQSVMINEHIFLLRCQNSTTQKFLFFILHSQSGQSILKSKVTGSAQGGLSLSNLKDMKIPKPDIKIQKQIVSECEKVEEQYNTIRMSIEKYQELIRAILVKCGIVDSSE